MKPSLAYHLAVGWLCAEAAEVLAPDRVSLELGVEDLFCQEDIQDGLESLTPVIVEGMAYESLPFPVMENDEWRSAWAQGDHGDAGSMDGQYQREQSAQVKVGQSVVVRLPVTHGPKREYLWKLNMTYDDDTFLLNRHEQAASAMGTAASIQFILENSGYVAPRSADETAYQQLVFKGIQPGTLKLPFVYNRPWYNDLQPGGAATFVTVRVLPRRAPSQPGTSPGVSSVHPVTKTSFTVYKGQHVEIKLGNSPTQQYNLWKMMEIFDTASGHVLQGPNKTPLLEFVFNESGYVPPTLAPVSESARNETLSAATRSLPALPIIRSAGYQKFTMFARAPGRQILHFAFVKPWLPDDQPDKTTALIDITVLERPSKGLGNSVSGAHARASS